MAQYWRKSKETCPKCGQHTEQLVETSWSGSRKITLVSGERCRFCGWTVKH